MEMDLEVCVSVGSGGQEVAAVEKVMARKPGGGTGALSALTGLSILPVAETLQIYSFQELHSQQPVDLSLSLYSRSGQ